MLLRMALFFLNYPVRISQKSCRATPDFIRIAETYSYDEKKIKIMIRRYNSEEALDKVSVEKEDEQQDVKYIRGGVEHSVAQNRSIYTASWTNGLNVVSIIGDMTEEELEQMIDSIYT